MMSSALQVLDQGVGVYIFEASEVRIELSA